MEILVVVRAGLRQRLTAQHQPRHDSMRQSPPGSRLMMLSRHGVAIEVGGRDAGAAR